MNNKFIIFFGIVMSLFISISVVSSLDECQSVETANIGCEIITPQLTCSTYDLYNSSRSLVIDDGGMTQLGSTGVYNFTFNQSNLGDWTILLCSNQTSVITIGITDKANSNSINTTLFNKIDAINSSLDSHISNINSSLSDQIIVVNDNLISINSTLYNEVDALEENLTRYGSNATWIGSSTWAYPTRTIDFTNSTGTVNASAAIDNVAIASAVWDMNLTAEGYTETNTGMAGSVMRYIAKAVYWVERLL